MNLAKHTFFLFGGSFLTKLAPVLQEKGTVVGQLIGVSPLSRICICQQLRPNEISEWLPLLEAELEKCKAEYLVLDLQTALRGLFYSAGERITASADLLAQLKRPEIAAVDPTTLTKKQIKSAMKRFLKVLTKHFPAEKIILLHTSFPTYWLAGNSLRLLETPFSNKAHQKFLHNLETHFRNQVADCRYIDVSRFYFYQKEVGRPLTDVIFEKECYIDVAKRIFCLTEGKNYNPNRPDFSLSLDRYVSYFFTLQKKPQRIFLNAENFLDRLILSADEKFVAAHRDELLLLDRLDWHTPKQITANLETLNPHDLLTKVCAAFHAAINGDYAADVDYALMFRCEVVPDNLLEHLKEAYAPTARLLPSQINRYNAGYHFAKMQGLDPTPFCTERTVAAPEIIDIFGSCISRTLFNVLDHDFAINRYWFHVPPFEKQNQKVSYPSDIFPEKLSWTDRLVKLQFDCGVFQSIRNSPAKWLVIDLFSLISPNNFQFQNCLYGDFDHRISNALKARKINLFLNPGSFGTHEDMIHAMDPWLELIKEKYGNKIILVTGQRMDHWIGDDDRIYRLKVKSSACNPLLEQASDYLLSKLNCYCIDIGKHFLPEECGYMRNTPTHKEDLCYFASHALVRHIVDQSPAQKHYDRYPGNIQMAHLQRLAKNNTSAVLQSALPLSELDKAVVSLGEEERSELGEKIANLYDSCNWNAPLDQILDDTACDLVVAEALKKASRKMSTKSSDCPNNYPLYPADSQIVSNPFGGCHLPKMSSVKIKEISYKKGQILLSWEAPAEATVRIYRSDGNAPWRMIHKTEASEFTDATVPPDVNYRYSLCIETPHKEKIILHSFTKPYYVKRTFAKRLFYKARAIVYRFAKYLHLHHPSLATPLIRSAFCLNGINTLRWTSVFGADSYQIYRKNSTQQEWELCATIAASSGTSYSEPAIPSDGNQWYAVRAQHNQKVGDLSPGIHALPL